MRAIVIAAAVMLSAARVLARVRERGENRAFSEGVAMLFDRSPHAA